MKILSGETSLFNHELNKKMREQIYEDQKNLGSDQESKMSYQIHKWLQSSGIGDLLEIINCVMTIILILFYIISSYTYPETSNKCIKVNKVINQIELYFCLCFIFHFVIKFYSSQSRIFFIFDFICLIDYLSIILLILAQQSFINLEIRYFFRSFRMIRIIYLFRLESIAQRHYNQTMKYRCQFILRALSVILISCCFIGEIENYGFRNETGGIHNNALKAVSQLLRFHDLVYFMIVTMTTTGFGDITPKSIFSKIVVIADFCLLFAFISPSWSKLSTILELSSVYSRISYKRRGNKKHILLLSNCGTESMRAFLEELYNEDHGYTNYDTVIMQSSQNNDIMKLIKSFPFENKIHYLVGNHLEVNDLERCQADKALCTIILANKLAENYINEDFSNIMKTLSFQNYCQTSQVKENRVCIQLLCPSSKKLFLSALGKSNNDQIICIEELKLQLIGKSCLCPGITTIISALITSKTPSIKENIELVEKKPWLSEYLEGIQLEIYAVSLRAEILLNFKFIELAKLLYQLTDLIVIGIDIIIDDIPPFVCLNPSNYLPSPFDHYIYVLAAQQPNEEKINELLRNYLEKQRPGAISTNRDKIGLLRKKNKFWSMMKISTEEGNKYNNENVYKPNIKTNQFKYNEDSFNFLENISKKKLKQFKKVKDKFIHTILPRTQNEAENFDPNCLINHIIICGVGKNLKYLLMPLRASSMKNQQSTILIIDTLDHIPSEIWKDIQYFPDIYYLQGSPLSPKDLAKAGIKKAKAVIILSKSSVEPGQSGFVDTDMIITSKGIKNETKNALVITELVMKESIRLISPLINGEQEKKNDFWLSEQFAIGEIYISSMLDTLVCQAFYNPFIVNILQQLIIGSAGSHLSSRMMDKLEEKKIELSTLFLLNISEEILKFGHRDYPKKVSYGEIVKLFFNKNMIPIGLNRNPSNYSSNPSKFFQKYVYLQPNPDTIIETDYDKIYVLAGEEYMRNEKTISSTRNNLKKPSELSKMIDQLNEEARSSVDRIESVVKYIDRIYGIGLAPKRIVNCSRISFCNGLANMHDALLGDEKENELSEHDELIKESSGEESEEEDEKSV